MIYYLIKVPYISAGLRRSYNKQLEVYELIVDENSTFLKTTGVWTCKKGIWVYSKSSKFLEILKNNIDKKITTEFEDVSKLYNCSSVVIYKDLELAQISKILMIDELKKEYEREIQGIRKLMEKNVPDVTEQIKEIKSKHAEYFI